MGGISGGYISAIRDFLLPLGWCAYYLFVLRDLGVLADFLKFWVEPSR